MVSNHTFLSRVAQFRGENTVEKQTPLDTNYTTAPEKGNGKGKGKNKNKTDKEKNEKEKQAKEDRANHLQTLFDANNSQAIANLALRHNGRQCYVHGPNCKHNLFQCKIYHRLADRNKTTADGACALVTENLPDFDGNEGFVARRATSDANRANTSSNSNATGGDNNNNSTVNNTSMYSLSPNPSFNITITDHNQPNTSTLMSPASPSPAKIDTDSPRIQ